MSKIIELSEKSINELSELCGVVRKRNSKNEISTKMAKGISEYIATNEFVTEKQAMWLARNLDFYGIERPIELADIVIEKSGNSTPPSGSTTTSSSPRDTFQGQIIESLRRIERLLSNL